MKKVLIVGLLVAVGAIIMIFSMQGQPENVESTSTAVKTISIGTIHRDAAKMTERFQPMADYLGEKISDDSVKYIGKVIVPETPEKLIQQIQNKEIDIYFDSPMIGMMIKQDTDINPKLFAWKEGVKSYYTVFVSPKNSTIKSMEILEGKTVIFEDSESTSGYHLPKIHLEQLGYTVGNDPESDISFEFSLDDENTPIWLLEGKGDFGALSNLDFEDIPENAKNELEVIGKTGEVPRYIVFLRDGLENESEIIDIFLGMNESSVPDIMEASDITQFSKLDPQKDLSQIKTLLEILQ